MARMTGKRTPGARTPSTGTPGARATAAATGTGGRRERRGPAPHTFELTESGYGSLSRQFPSTPRGARLARLAVVKQLGHWGFGPMSDASCTVALVVGELAANAVCHGKLRGRDFFVRVNYEGPASRFRIEVSDALLVRTPEHPVLPPDDQESGRGLCLVASLATRWGWEPRDPIGKTVWAEVTAERPGYGA
ncbi:ATP-binding protein [Streptomyces sp. NPDC012600]|uniref:ATP-binding protein n=2 Tax=Streptomyces TaxID=1883 RepID=A0ABU2VVP4_9ACTN|nr:ATP-binding protein [Streptomyces griseus]MDT0489683.1 ATP-binding protein [Streptomyces griseus]